MVERNTGNNSEQSPQQLHAAALEAFNKQLFEEYDAEILREKYENLEDSGRLVFGNPLDYIIELHNATTLAKIRATNSRDKLTAEFFGGLNKGIRIAMVMLRDPNTSSTPRDMTKAKS